MPGLAVVGELRVGRQGVGPESGGGGVPARVVAELGEGQAFRGVPGLVFPLQDRGQTLADRGGPLGLGDPLPGRIGPLGPLRAQLVTPPELREGLGMFPLRPEGMPEIAMGLGEVGCQADGLAERGDRLVRLPQRARGDAEVVVGLGAVRLEPDRLAVLGDRLVQLPLVVQGVAEVVVGLGEVGLEPDRLAVLGDRLVQLPLVAQGDCRG